MTKPDERVEILQGMSRHLRSVGDPESHIVSILDSKNALFERPLVEMDVYAIAIGTYRPTNDWCTWAAKTNGTTPAIEYEKAMKREKEKQNART